MWSVNSFNLGESKIMRLEKGYITLFIPLLDDKILAMSKLKAFVDDNFIVTQTKYLFFFIE